MIADPSPRKGRLRYWVLLVLFITTAVNYADRSTISIAGPAIAADLHLDPVVLGYLFSAFGWSYVLAQLPGGWLLDRFGSRAVYVTALLAWALFTGLQSGVALLGATAAVVVLFILRFLVGMAEAPCFPANSRIVTAWFPAHERGTASAVFNSGEYFSMVLFAPIFGWIVFHFGWHWVFVSVAGLVLLLAFVCHRMLLPPTRHPAMTPEELRYIERGGGLAGMDQRRTPPQWRYLRDLLGNRMLVGIYLGQFGINAITYFFVTWFPVYLVEAHHMSILQAGFVAPIPSICGFLGGITGGVVSDRLLRRGHNLTFARKLPVVLGMLISMSIFSCNYVAAGWAVVALMALAYFGKAFGALGWAIVSDTSPKAAVGLAGGLFNCIGNTAAITTPIIIGYIVKSTGSFHGALLYVAGNALLTIFSYLFIVGEIKRMELVAA